MSVFKLISAFLFRYWHYISVFFIAIITIASLAPLSQLPEVSGGDKLHHVFSYAILMLPAAIVKPKQFYCLFFVFLMWGGLIELVQPYVNRFAEWSDFFANGLGLTLGLAIGKLNIQ